MAYIDEAFLNDAFGSDQVAALCPTAGELATTIDLAEAEIESALTDAGYDSAVPSSVYASVSSVPKLIKLAAYGAWLELAHLRNDKPLPEEARRYTGKIDLLRENKLTIPNLTRNTSRSTGGSLSTETSESVSSDDGSRPPVFDAESLSGF